MIRSGGVIGVIGRIIKFWPRIRATSCTKTCFPEAVGPLSKGNCLLEKAVRKVYIDFSKERSQT